MKRDVHDVLEVRIISKKIPKVRKTFSLSSYVCAALHDNVEEGKVSQYVEKAILAQMKRDAMI